MVRTLITQGGMLGFASGGREGSRREPASAQSVIIKALAEAEACVPNLATAGE